jgi:putative membrane protein
VTALTLPPFRWHLSAIVILGGIVVAYFVTVRRHERATGDGWDSARQRRLFVCGMTTLMIGALWPIHDLSEHYLYSVHMFQHLLFALVAPPMLIAGTPVWMLRAWLKIKPIRALARFFTRPLVAILFFNAVLFFTHWPAIVTASVQSENFHLALHTLLVFAALIMWWPIMSPLPELPALSAPAQMMYLFFQSLAPTIPASFLTFGSKPLYPIYATFPRIWGIGAMRDQLIAGLEMKLLGGFILWGFIATIFFRWHDQEQKQDGWDPLRYTDVERQIRSEVR